VADSDGTLIIRFGEPQGGTRATIHSCIEQQKPHAIIDPSRTPLEEAVAVCTAVPLLDKLVVFARVSRIDTGRPGRSYSHSNAPSSKLEPPASAPGTHPLAC
jgi:hypothetical protein